MAVRPTRGIVFVDGTPRCIHILSISHNHQPSLNSSVPVCSPKIYQKTILNNSTISLLSFSSLSCFFSSSVVKSEQLLTTPTPAFGAHLVDLPAPVYSKARKRDQANTTMPAKAPVDENVKFLFACLLRSDYKTVGQPSPLQSHSLTHQTQIDFARVAADFSINPAAARMRWSRLKKTINPDEFLPHAPPKVKWPPRRTESSDQKETKQIVRGIQKEKRTERKAKVRAEQKIGIVAKSEGMPLEDDDGEHAGGEAKGGDAGNKNEEESVRAGHSDKPTAFKTEDKSMADSGLSPKVDTFNHFGSPHPALGLFHPVPTSPPTPVPASSRVQVPELDDETDIEVWGMSITVKPESGFNASTVGVPTPTSPYSSSSSFSPASSARTSASPPAQSQRASLKRRGDSIRVCKTRSRSRKSVGDGEGLGV